MIIAYVTQIQYISSGYQNWMQKEHGSYRLQIDILYPQMFA